MFKEITDVFTWLNNAGVFAFLVVLISAVYKLVKPLLTRKAQTAPLLPIHHLHRLLS